MIEDVSMVHIGYCIGRDWWHQGITSEAMKVVMDFFFEEVGANRIESRHDPRNPNFGRHPKAHMPIEHMSDKHVFGHDDKTKAY